jgi:hypothetical protein
MACRAAKNQIVFEVIRKREGFFSMVIGSSVSLQLHTYYDVKRANHPIRRRFYKVRSVA